MLLNDETISAIDGAIATTISVMAGANGAIASTI